MRIGRRELFERSAVALGALALSDAARRLAAATLIERDDERPASSRERMWVVAAYGWVAHWEQVGTSGPDPDQLFVKTRIIRSPTRPQEGSTQFLRSSWLGYQRIVGEL